MKFESVLDRRKTKNKLDKPCIDTPKSKEFVSRTLKNVRILRTALCSMKRREDSRGPSGDVKKTKSVDQRSLEKREDAKVFKG